ncbi:MAG: SDR family oxidoreductase, partial [Deltaproteobacteria bacterium]|nr:SDR family oxidoreductase [Deltaproteobacteria bacterium]
AKLGSIQILVNNAAVFEKTPLFEITEADWDRHLHINLKAPFFLAQAVAKKMADNKEGCIINMLDATFQKPHKGYLPYNVSKAGLAALTKALAKEAAPHVRVNAVSLGPILPPEGYTKEKKEAAAQKTLLRRWGNPEEVAKTVCFLIEEAQFATGSVFLLDGGRLLA